MMNLDLENHQTQAVTRYMTAVVAAQRRRMWPQYSTHRMEAVMRLMVAVSAVVDRQCVESQEPHD